MLQDIAALARTISASNLEESSVSSDANEGDVPVQELAMQLGKRAFELAADAKYLSPFAVEARAEGYKREVRVGNELDTHTSC